MESSSDINKVFKDETIHYELLNECVSRLSKYLDKDKSNKIAESLWEFSNFYISNKRVSNLDYNLIIFEDTLLNLEKNFEKYNDKDENFTNSLLYKIRNDQIDMKKLVSLKPQELDEFQYKEILRRNQLIEKEKNNVKTTDAYMCFKCNKREVTITEAQTRSADEPMTLFITCQNCGAVFKK